MDVTKDTATLYASDRDVFLFVVDDLNPIEAGLAEEGRPTESVFDFVQGITAVARSKPQKDARLVMERKAKRLRENFYVATKGSELVTEHC